MYANTIILGRMTKDVEVKYTQDGKAIGKFSVVVNEKYKDVEKSHFYNCTAFGKTAENINKFFKKGNMIFLAATPKQNTWENAEGKKMSAIDFVVDRFSFTGEKKGSNAQTQQPQMNVSTDATFASEDIPF